MKIRFLGGAAEVGRLGMIVETGEHRMIVDYGISPTNPPKFPDPSPAIELALLTHAHLDHSGMIPWLASRYGMPIWATEITAVVSDILAIDSQRISEFEGYAEPFSKEDIVRARDLYEFMEYGKKRLWHGLEIEMLDAGHIPGAAMFRLAGEREVLFTGDINTIDTLLVRRTMPVKTDVLIMESTYAGRIHPDRRELMRQFLDKVLEVVDRGGVAIVPVFAVGRTQEMLMVLQREDFTLWLDGLGREISDLYLAMPRFIRDAKLLKRALRSARCVRSPGDRKKAMRSEVILTTSGMLDGGPVLDYIKHLNNPKNAILLTGYQVEGTNGRMLLEEGAIRIAGAKVPVKAEVVQFDFSAHAGHDQLVEFAEACDPEVIVLIHGDNREALREDLKDFRVVLPHVGETYEI